MAIHEQLPKPVRKEAKQLGWSKALGLAKVARKTQQAFDCATWLHKARHLSKEDFELEIERCINGPDAEPWEIIYFKIFKSQMLVVERAMSTAAKMLGSDRSRGYCLEMICADFLAGASLQEDDPEVLLHALCSLIHCLPSERQEVLFARLRVPHEQFQAIAS